MRYLLTAVLLLAIAGSAMAVNVAEWKVSTVHGAYQFFIENDGSQLRFLEQPRNDMGWYWVNNNGSAPGVLATGGLGPNGWRDGSKTFAMTNVAYGQPLNTVKLEFSYYMPLGTSVWNYPSINFFITDGLGRYGIWSPGSGGMQYFTPVRNGDWMTMTMDLSSPALNDSLGGFAIYEHNGFTNDFSQPFTYMQWGGIKNYKLAGFSDYQRNPATGWGNWGGAWDVINSSWCPIVVRNGSGTGLPPQINGTYVGGVPAVEFVISEGGMKAAWGTKALDGKKVRDIEGYVSRLDDPSRFTAGSGPAVAPYFNIWVTDGAGKFAVIGNEPSNAEWTGTPGSSRNFDWNFLKTKTAKAYENNDKTWLPNNGVGLTFNDLADYTILAPTPAQLTAGWAGLGPGAPRELVTNKAYGFNWVLGDTLSNYVSGAPGYILANPAIKKDGPEFNEYGITLNWGDTVCSAGSGYDTQQRLIKDVLVTVGATEYSTVFEADQSAPNLLSLDVTEDTVYVKPSEKVVVDLNVSNLTQPIVALQSMLNFSSTYFVASVGTAGVSVEAGGGVWDNLIWNLQNTSGDLDVSVGVDFELSGGTQTDGTTAVITLTPTGTEGTTQMVFQADDGTDIGSTWLANVAGETVWPTKFDSTDIVIDGTAPTGVTIAADPVSWTKDSPVTLTFSASDALAGIDHYELSLDGGGFFTATSPYAWDVSALATGTYDATVKAIDKAGNFATASTTVYIDKTAPLISVDSAVENTTNVLDGANTTLQGTVVITVSASDAHAGLDGVPAVTLTNGLDNAVLTTSDTASPFHYNWVVGTATANGTWTINASVSDLAGNSASDTNNWLVVNKNQISGTITDDFVGAGTRTVTFYLDGTLLKTAEVAADGVYTLTDVPTGVTAVSAKTAWTLRQKLTGLSATDGQITANFTLLGGDINETNSINVLDYAKMKASWGGGTVGDIDGVFGTNSADYDIMKANWFKVGGAK